MQNIRLFVGAEVKLLLLTIVLYGLSFWYLGISMPWLIAIGIALVALLPVVGAGIVFIPWVLIEWLQGDTEIGWWLFAVYVVVEIITESLQPILVGKDLKIPFWLPIVVTIVCTMIFNIFGVIVAGILIPLIAAFKQVKYLESTGQLSDK